MRAFQTAGGIFILLRQRKEMFATGTSNRQSQFSSSTIPALYNVIELKCVYTRVNTFRHCSTFFMSITTRDPAFTNYFIYSTTCAQ